MTNAVGYATDITQIEPNRARFVAALHAAANYIAAHPDMPVPQVVSLRAHAGNMCGESDVTRVGLLNMFAATHNAERYHLPPSAGLDDRRHEYADLRIHQDGAAEITYTLSTTINHAKEDDR
jgi:hypothetical protein